MTKTYKKFNAFDIINTLLMTIIICITLYPLLYVVAISFSSSEFVQANMVKIIPKGFNFGAYAEVMGNEFFWTAYKNTILYTVVGTSINLVFTCTLAFCLSRKELIFRDAISILVVLTMFFSGGLIPNFLLIKWLGMYNTIWAIVIPGAISTYNMIIVRTYMQGLPEEIFESVRIDGGNDLQIYLKIVLPLSKPVIATIGLFYAVGHWNSYFAPMIYFKDRALYPLQIILREMIVEQTFQDMAGDLAEAFGQSPPTSEMLISSSIVIALIPILCVYPFIQKYFVKGVMIGSLKG
ncbi:MAG: carbohydrate ABC transporter permease [Epulopiscium sp.]|nr:carbohydrate ABC transporter permease [Candidatus Epulonipiscium sp.]